MAVHQIGIWLCIIPFVVYMERVAATIVNGEFVVEDVVEYNAAIAVDDDIREVMQARAELQQRDSKSFKMRFCYLGNTSSDNEWKFTSRD